MNVDHSRVSDVTNIKSQKCCLLLPHFNSTIPGNIIVLTSPQKSKKSKKIQSRNNSLHSSTTSFYRDADNNARYYYYQSIASLLSSALTQIDEKSLSSQYTHRPLHRISRGKTQLGRSVPLPARRGILQNALSRLEPMVHLLMTGHAYVRVFDLLFCCFITAITYEHKQIIITKLTRQIFYIKIVS